MAEFFNAFLEQQIELVAIILGKEYTLITVSPEDNMINCARKMDAWFAGHVVSLH